MKKIPQKLGSPTLCSIQIDMIATRQGTQFESCCLARVMNYFSLYVRSCLSYPQGDL
jgi:hypothetical protein